MVYVSAAGSWSAAKRAGYIWFWQSRHHMEGKILRRPFYVSQCIRFGRSSSKDTEKADIYYAYFIERLKLNGCRWYFVTIWSGFVYLPTNLS